MNPSKPITANTYEELIPLKAAEMMDLPQPRPLTAIPSSVY